MVKHKKELPIFLFILLFYMIGCERFPEPSDDADLEKWFLTNRHAFEQLAIMAEEDKSLARIAPTFFKVGSNNSNPIYQASALLDLQRWDEYRKLFRLLKLDRGILRLPNYPNAVLMIPPGTDPHAGLQSKGFAFSREALSPTCKDLDKMSFKNSNGEICFRHLVGNWYLFALFIEPV
jgi:hypothetical protein